MEKVTRIQPRRRVSDSYGPSFDIKLLSTVLDIKDCTPRSRQELSLLLRDLKAGEYSAVFGWIQRSGLREGPL